MTAKDYRDIRQRIGTQRDVSRMLGVNKNTLSDRERGINRITKEAELALRRIYEACTQRLEK